MSAPNLVIANPNDFTGHTSSISRIAVMHSVKRGDAVRSLWINYILPQVTNTKFLDSVIGSSDFFKTFKLNVSADFDDFNWSLHENVAAYQNLAQLTDKNIPTRLVPWQIRFEFADAILPRIMTSSLDFHFEIGTLFEKAGWQYWRTETGFCVWPLWMYEELKSHSTLYQAWITMRDFKGAGFSDFAVEDRSPPPLWRVTKETAQSVLKESGALDGMPALESPGIADAEYNNYPNYVGGSNAAAGSLSAAGRTA